MEVAHHRNGIRGRGFHVVLFEGEDGNRMVAIVPDEGPSDEGVECYALDIDLLHEGNIKFAGGNSWRGDYIMEQLIEQGFNQLVNV